MLIHNSTMDVNEQSITPHEKEIISVCYTFLHYASTISIEYELRLSFFFFFLFIPAEISTRIYH